MFVEYDQTEFTGWSLGALFTMQCNLPVLFRPENNDRFAGRQERRRTSERRTDLSARARTANDDEWWREGQITCLPELLASANYSLYATTACRGNIQHVNELFTEHGWNYTSGEETNCFTDWCAAQYIDKTIFPALTEAVASDKPFAFVWWTRFPHMWERGGNDGFPVRFRYPEPLAKSYDHVDEIVEWLIRRARDQSWWNSTQLVIAGDHRHLRPAAWMLNQPRRVLLAFPDLPRHVSHAPGSAYDFAPTILDLVGLKSAVPFPFGRSLLTDAESRPHVPTPEEMAVINLEYGVASELHRSE